ncbi:MAG: class I SAM-dependent methyltransferase, partial [Candidatus Hodarchaeota archaeon]
MKLTTKQFWDSRHEAYSELPVSNAKARKGLIRKIVDNARLKQGAYVNQSYSSFLFDRLLKAHMPIRPDWSVIEIGSAPGSNLVNLNRNFGYKPYGVEYSHAGVVLTQETFRKHGFNADNVIEADFFEEEFQNKFRSTFDVVFSRGFIEHFDRPDEVVRLHINLLKPGGYLVCTIPNLLGTSYPYFRLCANDILKSHNCSIMRKDVFRRIFEPFGLEVKFCGYIGALQFGGCLSSSESSLRNYIAAVLERIQDILDHCMFLL